MRPLHLWQYQSGASHRMYFDTPPPHRVVLERHKALWSEG